MVYWLCIVYPGSWKKPFDDSQQSASVFIFLSNICYANKAAIEVAMYKNIELPRKKNTGMYVNKLFSLTVGAVTQKSYYIIAKKITEEFMVFFQPFRIDRMFNVDFTNLCSNSPKIKILESLILKTAWIIVKIAEEYGTQEF